MTEPVSSLRKLRSTARCPATQRLSRLRIYLLFESLLSVFVGHGARRKAAIRKAALDHLARQVPDEALRAKLTPDYEPGCKRLLLSDDYYPSLHASQRRGGGVTGGLVHRPRGRRAGRHRPPGRRGDHGHRASRRPSRRTPSTSSGGTAPASPRSGRRTASRPMLGSTVAGFPNLFLMIGPNATLAHNSMIYMIESHINYIASALAFMARPGVRVVEVKPGVQRRYNERLQARLEHSVWVDGGCGSWYLDHRGRNTTLWPDHTWKFRRLTRRFHPGEYTVRA